MTYAFCPGNVACIGLATVTDILLLVNRSSTMQLMMAKYIIRKMYHLVLNVVVF